MKTPVAYLNSNNGKGILFFGAGEIAVFSNGDALNRLDEFRSKYPNRYLFTTLSYDLKNEIEALESNNLDSIQFPDLICWDAEFVVEIENGKFTFLQGNHSEEAEKWVVNFLNDIEISDKKLPKIKFQARISKETYLKEVTNIQNEIQLGNSYELNFCQEFYAENIPEFKASSLLAAQSELAKAPFSAFVDILDFQIYCASPERFMERKGSRLISQPIKGTIKRGADLLEDEKLKNQLKTDPKERAENIMITDLVRNDFSRIAAKNSVQVDELCGIHTFETVHHMISTISCEIDDSKTISDILKATFPMGSMTGAPKISSMKLIEKHESFKRGLYSGSIGYIKPNDDFDFNVVIRTFIVNTKTNTISCSVGGAITMQAKAEQEFEECLVKVKRMLQLFGDDQHI
jgi:para-aminobenzoate synthetase component 1